MKPHTSAQSPGTPPGPHNSVGPGGTGRFVLAKASSKMLVRRRSLPHGRRQAAPLKSPATKSTCCSSITVRTVSNIIFPMPRFLANWFLMCNDIIEKNDVPLRGSRRNDARTTACRTQLHPEYTGSRNEVGSSKSTFFIKFFHMRDIFGFPAILMSYTYTDKNDPCFR